MRYVFVLCTVLAAVTPAFAADIAVNEANQKFDKDSVTLKAGDALILTNSDSGDHSLKMTDEDGEPQDLGLQKPGRAVRVNFPNSGSYKIRCSITPDMRLNVVVN